MVRLPRLRKPASGLKPLRVLIVEDSENDALLLMRELRRGGYEPEYERVETAEAMDEALANSEWDVIVSDYRLPRFSALDALKVFKESGADAPFIVVSGKVGEEAAVEVMKAGAYDFLTKGNLALDYLTKGTMPLLCPTVERGLEEAKERRETKRTKEELSRRDAVLEAVRFAAERFLGETHGWEENVRAVLRRLGEAAEVSRVYIFENYTGEDGEIWATQRYEWAAPNVSAQIENPLLKALPYREAGFGRWIEVLGRGDLVYGHTRDFPESEQPELQAEEILSIVVVPIFVEGTWWGFVGFDECLSEREWYAAEMDALQAAASTLGAAVRRKRAEEALRESEERYSLVLQGSNDGIFDWNISTGELYWNDRIHEMLGLSRSEVSPTLELFVERLHPEDRQRVLDAINAHLERGVKYSEEFRLRRSSGGYVYCIGRGIAQRDENNVPVRMAGTVTDITERKRAEEKLRASEAELRALFESMTDLIFVYDSEGRYLKIAPTNPSLLYRPSGKLLGRTLHEVLPKEQADGLLSNIRRALETQQSVNYEYDLRIRGRQMWFEATISPMMENLVVAVVRDVTERARMRELLEERVATLSAIATRVTLDLPMEDTLDALAEGVVKASTAVACSLVLAEEGTESLYPVGSYGLPEGYAASLQEVFRSGVQSPTLEAAHTRQPVLVRDVRRFILSEPRYAPLHRFVREAPWDTVYIVPLVSRGKALGAINLRYLPGQEPGEDERSFLKAVADQTAVAVENVRLFVQARGKAALEERQRLARELHDSVSQALYGIALGAKTARAFMKRNPDQAAEPLDYVLSLADAGLAEMRALIFELRPESLETEGLVVALEKQAAALRARHEIEVEADLCHEPDAPLEIKEALYRVAQEALHNTVKHARASSVQIRMRCSPEQITLDVSDDGVGFDPTKDFPGHLGLHSMRERTERLGGTLAVESAPGKGTEIRAWMPIRGTIAMDPSL